MPRKHKHNNKHKPYVQPDYHSQNKKDDGDNNTISNKKTKKKNKFKLRTSNDIYKRLIHDPKIGVDHKYISIGYETTEQKTEEMPLLHWKTSKDGGNIPMHRIQYFVLYLLDGQKIIIWDRTTKLDRLFMSGDSNKNTESLRSLLSFIISPCNIPRPKSPNSHEIDDECDSKYDPEINSKSTICPTIHLKQSQFRSQDYDQQHISPTIIQPAVNNIASEQHPAIYLIDQLLEHFADPQQQPQYKQVHIVHISDTHQSFNEYPIPFKPDKVNILIHIGDLSTSACLTANGSIPTHFKRFSAWFRNLPHHKKVVIAGNHDIAFRQLGADNVHSRIFASDPSVIYLQDEMVNLYGLNIYGTPWTDKGAFKANMDRPRGKRKKKRHKEGLETLKQKWMRIPDGIDILVSHMNPLSDDEHGDKDLLNEVVNRVKPKVHLFGHNHDNVGWKVIKNIMFINSAMEKKRIPHEFDIVFNL